ncbi:hypothetical protein ACFWH1_09410 [Streptomyces sp. NPDC127037]|uniref:hypothetical protein n=1 Tax=Streptomyces sp. NPDC127037 TaxID=3347113 RepID=UPI003663EFAD
MSITHATDLAPITPFRPTPLVRQAADLTYLPRPREAVKAFLGDWPLLEPGPVPTAQWVPMGDVRDRPSGAYAGVAIKPATAAEQREA